MSSFASLIWNKHCWLDRLGWPGGLLVRLVATFRLVTDEVVHGFSKLEFCEFSVEQVWLTKLFDCIRKENQFPNKQEISRSLMRVNSSNWRTNNELRIWANIVQFTSLSSSLQRDEVVQVGEIRLADDGVEERPFASRWANEVSWMNSNGRFAPHRDSL